MSEIPSRAQLQSEAHFLREWAIHGFLPDNPAGKPNINLPIAGFNEYAVSEFQKLHTPDLADGEMRVMRNILGSNIRAYWGAKLRDHIGKLESGIVPGDGTRADFSSVPSYHTATGELRSRRNPNILTMQVEGEKGSSSSLVIESTKDTPVYDFKLHTELAPQAPDYVKTEYEIDMTFGWGAPTTDSLSVTKIQSSSLKAPGLWEKERAEMGTGDGFDVTSGQESVAASAETTLEVGAPDSIRERRRGGNSEIKVSLRDGGEELLPMRELMDRFELRRVNILRLHADGIIRGARIGDTWYLSPDDIQKYIAGENK